MGKFTMFINYEELDVTFVLVSNYEIEIIGYLLVYVINIQHLSKFNRMYMLYSLPVTIFYWGEDCAVLKLKQMCLMCCCISYCSALIRHIQGIKCNQVITSS